MLIFSLHFVLIFLFAVCLVKGVFAGENPPRKGVEGDVPPMRASLRAKEKHERVNGSECFSIKG